MLLREKIKHNALVLILVRLTLFLILFSAMSCSSGNKKEIPGKSEVAKEKSKEKFNSSAKIVSIDPQTCVQCHGEKFEGNEQLGGPALKGQAFWYFKSQIHKFQSGIRGSKTEDTLGMQMKAIASSILLNADLENLYDRIQDVAEVAEHANFEGDIEKGKQNYNMVCGACHGPDANGNKVLNSPSLKVLNDWYIKRQYKKFQNGIRGMHEHDTTGAQMRAIAISGMVKSDQDLVDIISFIRSQNEK